MPQGFTVPQLVLRLGYPAQAMPPVTPRRPVAAAVLLVHQSDDSATG